MLALRCIGIQSSSASVFISSYRFPEPCMTALTHTYLLGKAFEALQAKKCWDAQCDLDKVATALLLNRPDWLKEIDYTLVEAAVRLGPDCLALLPRVAQSLLSLHAI